MANTYHVVKHTHIHMSVYSQSSRTQRPSVGNTDPTHTPQNLPASPFANPCAQLQPPDAGAPFGGLKGT